jgi:hypothetical protein
MKFLGSRRPRAQSYPSPRGGGSNEASEKKKKEGAHTRYARFACGLANPRVGLTQPPLCGEQAPKSKKTDGDDLAPKGAKF